MSFFDKLVGKRTKSPKTPKSSKSQKAPSLPEAIRRLKDTEDVLLKKQNSLEEKINKEIATAKKNARTNKKVALQAIQKKKRLERQLQHVDGALTTLEAQKEVLESANINTLVVSSINKTSKALKATHKNLDVDKVDQILDELAEQRDITNEISEAISHPVGFQDDDIDEDDLERELAELEAGVDDLSIEDQLPSVPQDISDKKERGESARSEKRKEREKVLVAS